MCALNEVKGMAVYMKKFDVLFTTDKGYIDIMLASLYSFLLNSKLENIRVHIITKDFSLEDYAKMCNMSKYHFLRVFSGIVGKTPLEYRNNIRLEHACELLSNEKLSVEEISASVGYSSASYFSSAFKKKYGISPKQYQQIK